MFHILTVIKLMGWYNRTLQQRHLYQTHYMKVFFWSYLLWLSYLRFNGDNSAISAWVIPFFHLLHCSTQCYASVYATSSLIIYRSNCIKLGLFSVQKWHFLSFSKYESYKLVPDVNAQSIPIGCPTPRNPLSAIPVSFRLEAPFRS